MTRSLMLIAGEASGDMLGAELVQALRHEFAQVQAVPTTDFQPLHTPIEPRFFGAGGPRMAAAGVDLAMDLTEHAVTGLSDVVKNYPKFRRFFHQLLRMARERAPEAIICVDFAGFNRRFARAIQQHVRSRSGWFHDWRPKIIQYVSPQVWASRADRVEQMARDYDLLLSIFPFEPPWYAKRIPRFPVRFVGHPIVDRYSTVRTRAAFHPMTGAASPTVLLLPGSRPKELSRHLPVLLGALAILRSTLPNLRALMVVPTQKLAQQAHAAGLPVNVKVQTDGLPEALGSADVALASTGTVTMECAYFGLPTVALYKTSWGTFQVGRRIVKVKYAAMPNLLADEEVFPEFIQYAATPHNIARAALLLLRDEERRVRMRARLREVIASLGGPGASQRAAQAIVSLLQSQNSAPR